MRPINPNLQRIDDWYKNGSLQAMFTYATRSGTSPNYSYFFRNIWRPFKVPTAQGLPDSWDWQNVGFTTDDLARIYAASYGKNYLPAFYPSLEEYETAHETDEVTRDVMAILKKNTPKYLKLMELDGYTYNPIWNVDGTELFSSADVHGDETTTNVFKDKHTHSVSTYDMGAKTEYIDTTENDPDGSGDTTTVSHAQTGIGASEDAFGNTLTDSDFYHADKRVRQGNIGVVSTQALVEEQRELLKYSLLDEFFRDINESILIGVY